MKFHNVTTLKLLLEKEFPCQQIWQTDMNVTHPYVLQLSEIQVVGW